MRILFLLLICSLNSINTNAQYKAVKLYVDSTKIYLRFFFKTYKSDEEVNDSVKIICRKIDTESFYLDKYINKRRVWTKTYRMEPAKDSMEVTKRMTDIKGKSRFIYSKEKYYNAILINPTK